MRRWILLFLPAIPLTGMGFVALGWHPDLLAIVFIAAITPWLVWVDLREHRLPNTLVVPAIGAGLVAVSLEWVLGGGPPIVPLVAAGSCAGLLLLLNLMGGMGMGDVKLAAALGLASWNGSVAVLSPVIAFLVGGLVSLVLLIVGRRGQRIAFGPFLLGGFWAAILLVALTGLVTPQGGPALLSLYR